MFSCLLLHAGTVGRPHVSEEAEPHSGIVCIETRFDFSNRGPLEFLEFLKSLHWPEAMKATRGFKLACIHKGWIREEDIPGLLALMESEEPCGGVAMSISSHSAPGPSTVGNEAAYLVMGYRKGEYPPSLESTSQLVTVEDKAALRHWWSRQNDRP
jgi:hypothetical protein